MKKILYTLIIIVFSCNLLIAQKFKKNETIIKSNNPLEISPNLNFEINTNIDSTIISKETLKKIKIIQPVIEKEENVEALNLINTIDEKDLEKNELLILKGTIEIKLDYLKSIHTVVT